MPTLFNDTIPAGGESPEITVTPLSPLGFNTDRGVTVQAKNTAPGTASWAQIYASQDADSRILYPTSAVIKIKAGAAAARVLIVEA